MTHWNWPATLNTVVALLVGGGLAMAGQALADLRARRRDREARRETFLIQNFAAQREALMKIQEMVEEFTERLFYELIERAGDNWRGFMASPENRQAFSELADVALARSDSSRDEEQRSSVEMRFQERFVNFKTNYSRSADATDKRLHFWREFSAFETELTMQANRTGSQLIVAEARSYIAAAQEYEDGHYRGERDHSRSDPFSARTSLQAAVTRALTEGPLAA